MTNYVRNLGEIDDSLQKVGGKARNLAKLCRMDGIKVPDGFVVTTDAFREMVHNHPDLRYSLDELTRIQPSGTPNLSDRSGEAGRSKIAELSHRIRTIIEAFPLWDSLQSEVRSALARFERDTCFAIRSSATAEDLPESSFAGQQDTFLNIKGEEQALAHIKRCWASLFSERAVSYRTENGYPHDKVELAVIVQEMISSDVSGVMFTADPMTSDRKTLVIESCFGLGEALVSGLVEPDTFKLVDQEIVYSHLGAKHLQTHPNPLGGTRTEESTTAKTTASLSTEQVRSLAAHGRRIESGFGRPQDIEWCLKDDQPYILQSRPITTLFPIPESRETKAPRVFMSVGHLQMMTDPIRPLGISFFEPLAQFSLDKAGGRVFADVTYDLSSFVGKKRLVLATGKQDPLMQSAILGLMDDVQFMRSLPKGKRNLKGGVFTISSLFHAFKVWRQDDPSIIEQMLNEFKAEIVEVAEQLQGLSREDVFAFIGNDIRKMLEMAYNPRMLGAIIAALLAGENLNRNVEKWLGERNVSDILAKSLDHNITTEMGLALCDLSDVIRRNDKVRTYLEHYSSSKGRLFEELQKLPGGREIADAFVVFLNRYGMRCAGEIDITRARWEEEPEQLIPIILSNIRVLNENEHLEKFAKGRQEAKEKEAELCRRVSQLHGGKRKADKVRKYVSLLRNFAGCREYPKYFIVRRYHLYKKALLKEAFALVKKGVLKDYRDAFYLDFEEFRQAVSEENVNYKAIMERKQAYHHYARLTPPRIITSEGHVPPNRQDKTNVPENALKGIPVSSGVVEGRARVITSLTEANIEDGDILVARFTDPSWTPLFVSVRGVITEVGGYTTHGAVVTREYGLPAVVGVDNATKLIRDGQKVRLNGTEGFVELL